MGITAEIPICIKYKISILYIFFPDISFLFTYLYNHRIKWLHWWLCYPVINKYKNKILHDIKIEDVFLDARKASCLLIDLVANVLKFALNATETKCEYGEYQTIEQDDQNETEPRIQELYRNVCEEYITKHGERCVEKCFDDGEWIELV